MHMRERDIERRNTISMSSWSYGAGPLSYLLKVRKGPKCLEDSVTDVYDMDMEYAMEPDDTEGLNEF